ncbi:Uncharacterized protein Adt_26797 [Abeliophyllum distichum]|uniref:Reverse transcriptase/retrotransposon-derived protein RNase H-like domain-containing protein n=1 Tax=Abeliophyllum distichum TaxID=126358 RepID=A0ABD1RW05_9LAMI
MVIGVPEINFLGMYIKDGQYSLQPHVEQKLLNFPDANLSKKEVQQFLGIVNYVADFIDHLSTAIKHLQNMLKKNALAWSEEQTKAIREIKQKVHGLPALSIPANGKRILQTDSSDQYWAAILLEEQNGKRSICGYKSASFSEVEKHYHSTFKEILAVKRGIEKFQFHLIGHHFFIKMDMSAFLKMMNFKQKQIPNSQLLRPPEIYPNIQKFPPEIHDLIANNTLKARSKGLMLKYQSLVIQNHGIHILGGLGFHPDYPFLNLFSFDFDRLQWGFFKEILCFLWYLLELH